MITIKNAETIARKFGTPSLLFSSDILIKQFNLLSDNLPDFTFFYAVKSNPYQKLLKTLAKLGCSFDVASIDELKLVIKILKEQGISAISDKIIYTHPIKTSEDIKKATTLGIKWFVIDNIYEIEKFKGIGKDLKILIRISINNPDAVINLSYKFGCEPDNAVNLIKACINNKLNVKGICFHVGSQNLNYYKYIEALQYVQELIKICNLDNIQISTIDIGGGFPINYLTRVTPIQDLGSNITSFIEKYLSQYNLIAEPGRFLSGPSFSLIARIIGKAQRKGVWWYYIDDGLYNSFSGKVFDSCNYRLLHNKKGDLKNSIIAGPTCDSFDIIYKNAALPEMKTGDILLFPSMGAYTNATATSFNSIPQTKIIDLNEISF